MRIAFIGDASLTHIRRWTGYFHDKGHQVLLLSFEQTEGYPFPAYRIPKRLPTKLAGYLASMPAVRERLGAFRPQLVNALYAGGYGLVGSLSGFRPLVVSALGSDLLVDYPSSLLHRIQIRKALADADLVTTDADNLSAAAARAGAPPGKILKVYFGIDEATFHQRPGGPPLSAGKGMPAVIASTRNLYRIYNLDHLLEAAPLILERIDALFTICGDGPERGRLEAKASSLGLAGKVSFIGRRGPDEIAELLRRTDIYVSTSLSDSTSVSLLESMASGSFPVVTDIPANREWIRDGENGMLVPPGSAEALAGAVVKAAQDASLLSLAAERNREIISERGLWKSNMDLLEREFLSLVRSRDPHAE